MGELVETFSSVQRENSEWHEPSCGARTKAQSDFLTHLRWRQRNNPLNLLREYLCTCGCVCVCVSVCSHVCIEIQREPKQCGARSLPFPWERNGWVQLERETNGRRGWGLLNVCTVAVRFTGEAGDAVLSSPAGQWNIWKSVTQPDCHVKCLLVTEHRQSLFSHK